MAAKTDIPISRPTAGRVDKTWSGISRSHWMDANHFPARCDPQHYSVARIREKAGAARLRRVRSH